MKSISIETTPEPRSGKLVFLIFWKSPIQTLRKPLAGYFIPNSPLIWEVITCTNIVTKEFALTRGGGLQIKMAFFIFTWIATADEKAVMTGSETKCKRNPKIIQNFNWTFLFKAVFMNLSIEHWSPSYADFRIDLIPSCYPVVSCTAGITNMKGSSMDTKVLTLYINIKCSRLRILLTKSFDICKKKWQELFIFFQQQSFSPSPF